MYNEHRIAEASLNGGQNHTTNDAQGLISARCEGENDSLQRRSAKILPLTPSPRAARIDQGLPNVSDGALGTIASVEHALESIEDRLRERKSDLKQYHKQCEDLTRQLDHPFEHEEKLVTTTKRQQEIVAALDITKNEASANADVGAEQASEAIEEKPQQAQRNFPFG